MKKLIMCLLLGAFLFTGCSDAKDLLADVEDAIEEAEEEIEEITDEIEEGMEELDAIEDEETGNDEKDAGKKDDDASETIDSEVVEDEALLTDTSDAIIFEPDMIYTGTLGPNETITYLIEAEVDDEFAFQLKNTGSVQAVFREVAEDENANSPFMISSGDGVITRTCSDGSELLVIENTNDVEIDYVWLGVMGTEADLQNSIEGAGGLNLPSADGKPLENAAFLIGDAGISVSEVRVFTEDAELELPSVPGKIYLYIKGTMDNNGAEALTFYKTLFFSAYDSDDNQIGDASSWLAEGDMAGDEVLPNEQGQFQKLLMFDETSVTVTVYFEGKIADTDYVFVVDTNAISDQAMEETADAEVATQDMLITMSNEIVTAIDEDNFAAVAEYAEYCFVAPTAVTELNEVVYFEDWNWEGCAASTDIVNFGTTGAGDPIELTYTELFDEYITQYDYVNTGSLAVEEDTDQQTTPWIDYWDMSHYVVYTAADGSHQLYLLYNEVYIDEFILVGIGCVE